MKYRCKFNPWWAMVAILVAASAWGAGPAVPVTTDLQADGASSNQRGVPIMLVFSAPGCHYCELLDRDFLKPMLISGDYTNKVLIRKVMIGDDAKLVDFAGKQVPADQLASRYHISVTPTVLFLDAKGRQLAPAMVGVSSPDYYGSYLDQSIAQALKHLHAERRSGTARHAASDTNASS
ncbi:MAG: thioredoxin fold domain-containing protein [Gammaproteobacteria bacterium]